MVANILMHEIGHALGLGHTGDEDHLMYSTVSPETSFDSNGYLIPERFDELYVGQKLLLIQEKEIQEKIGSLDAKIYDEQVLYDEYYEQHASYEEKTLPPKEYEQAQQAYDGLTLQTKKINTLILQQNESIDQINDILNQLGRNPNFEIVS